MKDKRYCPHCGNELKSSARFCPQCGAKVDPVYAADGPGNDKSSEKRSDKKWMKWILLIIALCVIVFTVLFFLLFKRNDQAREEFEEKTEVEVITQTEKTDAGEKVEDSSADSDTEAPIQDDSAGKYYADILLEYQQAEENGFSGDSSTYPHVNENLLDGGSYELFYTTIDLCNDGVPELFISRRIDGDSSFHVIMDIYGYESGAPRHLDIAIDLGKSPLDPDNNMGDETEYTVCENNMLREETITSVEEARVTYYELQKDTATLFVSDGAVLHGTDYYRNSSGLSADPISHEEYTSIVNKYEEKKDYDWKKLSDFKGSSTAASTIGSDTVKKDTVEKSSSVHELARTYYGDFLEYYKEQELTGFTTPDMELINPIFSSPQYFPEGYANSGTTLYYTVLDLADDGVPELFISDGSQLYGAFGLIESERQVSPLFDLRMGEYTEYQLCVDNMIRGYEREGNVIRIIAYYRVEPHAYDASCSEAVYTDMSNYYFATLENGKWNFQTAATYNDFKELETKYPVNENIEWLRLSDF